LQAVRTSAPVIAREERAIQYSEAFVINRKAAECWIPAFANSAPRPGHDARCSNGYRFAKRQGKPNSAGKRKPL
jgi:hypothetical protein